MMELPFTREQFFEVFEAYNAAFWPAVVALWAGSVLMAGLLLTQRHRPSDRVVSAWLGVHWAWAALAYHVAFFVAINPAAWLFAGLFLLQAGLLVWFGAVRGQVRFAAGRSAWRPMAWALIAYSLVYPGITAVQHGTLARVPTFGVPCPTTILTVGLLLLATPRPWAVSIVPILWSAIGGSAAFLLGVAADYVLPIAGLLLAASASVQRTRLPSLP